MSIGLDDYQKEAAARTGRAAVSRARSILRSVRHDAPQKDKDRAREQALDELRRERVSE